MTDTMVVSEKGSTNFQKNYGTYTKTIISRVNSMEKLEFRHFSHFKGQKRGGNCSPIEKIRPDSESSRQGASAGVIFGCLATIRNFDLIMGVNGGQIWRALSVDAILCRKIFRF